jgi:hypothetical protein
LKWAVMAILMVLLAGVFHVLFIVFDNVYYNDDNGVFHLLPESLNGSLSHSGQMHAYNQTKMFREAFGWGRVICLILVPGLIVIEALDRPKESR